MDEESVVRKFRTTAADGKNYNTIHYNLDMIISLGYIVKSKIATNFRRWAAERLKEYMIKGFTMDDERLKNLGGGKPNGLVFKFNVNFCISIFRLIYDDFTPNNIGLSL